MTGQDFAQGPRHSDSTVSQDLPLPNFFILGAPKAATTAISSALDDHPQIFMAPIKETNFFSWDAEYEKGLEYYSRTHFARGGAILARGEATPGYLASFPARERITSDLPSTSHRFVVILREPAQRAWSHYRYNLMQGVEPLTFPDALQAELDGLRTDPYGSGLLRYRHHGSYGTHLAAWLDRHSRNSFLFLRFEDVIHHPNDVFQAMFRFLGVAEDVAIQPRRENAGSVSRFGLLGAMNRAPESLRRPLRRALPLTARHRVIHVIAKLDRRAANKPIDPEIERRLREEMADEVRLAAKLTGLDLSAWLPR